MKIQQVQDQITIDNSIVSSLIISIILIIGGIVMVVVGLVQSAAVLSIIGAVVFLIGLLIIFVAKSSHIVLNKSGLCSVSSKSLFKSSASETFQLSDVSYVELAVRQNIASNSGMNKGGTSIGVGSTQNDLTSTIILATKTGQRITLGSGSRSMSLGGAVGAMIQDVPLKKQADQIAKFIGVEVQSSGDVGLKQAVGDISQIGRKIMGGDGDGDGSTVTSGSVESAVPTQPIQTQPPQENNNTNPTPTPNDSSDNTT